MPEKKPEIDPAQWDLADVDNLDGALSILHELGKETWICRGEPRYYPYSTPSLARKESFDHEPSLFDAEAHMIAQFRRVSASRLSPTETEMVRTVWGTLVLMQHYRSPTRLLDWTYSPWVAAFFACSAGLQEPGYLWAIPHEVCTELRADVPKKVLGDEDGFGPMVACKTLREWQDLMIPSADWEEGASDWLYFLQPTRAPGRVFAQQGLFTFGFPINACHRGMLASEKKGRVMRISAKIKADVAKTLSKMNITPASLFPDLTGAGEAMSHIFTLGIPTISPVDDWSR